VQKHKPRDSPYGTANNECQSYRQEKRKAESVEYACQDGTKHDKLAGAKIEHLRHAVDDHKPESDKGINATQGDAREKDPECLFYQTCLFRWPELPCQPSSKVAGRGKPTCFRHYLRHGGGAISKPGTTWWGGGSLNRASMKHVPGINPRWSSGLMDTVAPLDTMTFLTVSV
jgi:hypothetical protein